MNLISRILRRGFGFPAHLRGVKPASGIGVTKEEPTVVRSSFVLGRPRSRGPGVRLWRNITESNSLVFYSVGRCEKRPNSGPHRRPRNMRTWKIPEESPAAEATPAPVPDPMPRDWAEAATMLMERELSVRRYGFVDASRINVPDVIWWPIEGGSLKFVRPGKEYVPACSPEQAAEGRCR